MRLSYLLELVACLGAGLGFAIWQQRIIPSSTPTFRFDQRNLDLVSDFIWQVLIGVAVAGLVGLVVESLRRRGPTTWGFGRWVWSLIGFTLLCEYALMTAWAWLSGLYAIAVISRMDWTFASAGPAWLPLVFWITSRLARRPGDPKPDAREWSGRVLGVLVLFVRLGYELLAWAAHVYR
jgi:hypothetical protein